MWLHKTTLIHWNKGEGNLHITAMHYKWMVYPSILTWIDETYLKVISIMHRLNLYFLNGNVTSFFSYLACLKPLMLSTSYLCWCWIALKSVGQFLQMDCRERTGHFMYATLHSILNVIAAGPVLATNLRTVPSSALKMLPVVSSIQ